MSLFPNLNETFYVDNDAGLLKKMDYTYSKNITINQSFWTEADIDMRFTLGDMSVFQDIYGNLPAFRKRQFCFNHIRKIINMISGYQRQHRKTIVVEPNDSRGQKGADQFTKLLYDINNRGVYETISDAFMGALITGMNLLYVWVDYRDDPVSGTIKVDNLAHSSFLMDPYFTKMDLSDCENLWTRKYLSREAAAALLPNREDEIMKMSANGSRDGKFQFQPQAYNYGMQDLLTYDEFWYQDTRKRTILIDTTTGEMKEWRSNNNDDLEDFLREYPQVVKSVQTIPTVKLGIVLQGRVMYNGPSPLGTDTYPMVPVFAYFQPETPYFPWRIQGVSRGLRDSSYLYSRRKTIELDILESQVNSGWIFKENALVNPKDVFMQNQGRGIALRDDAEMTDIQRIEAPQVPPSMIQLSEILRQEITNISGVNEELLGSADDDKAGILSMLRQGAGLTTLQLLFDNLDRASKLIGKIEIELIQENYVPGKVQRILGEEPCPEFYTRAFMQYDAIVEEAPLTTTQKQLALQQALYLKEIGIPIPTSYLIKNMNITGKDELIEEIEKIEQQQNQQQSTMAQLQMQQLQVDNETKLSYANSQNSLAAERMNKVKLDAALSAERMQRADEDRTGAILNLIKAAKELESMDLEQIERAVNVMLQISNSEEKKDLTKNSLSDTQKVQGAAYG
jgi:hypothetical protein